MVPRSCRACGLLLRESARFCDGCGARAPGAGDAEYKHVTVMFADVVRSMDIAAAVGAERLSEIMAALIRRSAGVVNGYGGVVNQFTGDGLMAVFGVPNALEDHALLACLAALRIRDEARALAVDLQERDGIVFQVRIGLNSGEVVAGEIGSGALGYTTIGEQVGLAQRMESAAPADGVMLSATTARLVEDVAALGPLDAVTVKGRETPVPARLLHRIATENPHHRARRDPALVGRLPELSTVVTHIDRCRNAGGSTVRLVGPAGIGKSRLVDETRRLAAQRGVPSYTTFCESHTRGVPYRAMRRLLRAVFAVTGVPPEVARARVRSEMAVDDVDDLLLLEDLLGIGDPSAAAPEISPEARRRRLTSLARRLLEQSTSTLFVVEDAHWIDEASEAILAELVEVLPRTRSLLLITYRPDYRGALAQTPAAHSVVLTPLTEPDAATLVTELLGSDPSVKLLADRIVGRCSGNPFFITETVRDLAERGVLAGLRGLYRCADEAADITVPPTLHATLAARIDRLGPSCKSVLYTGAVIGMRFSTDLLEAVLHDVDGISLALADLSDAEMIEAVPSPPTAYVFRHPLLRAVAYESQLKAARAEKHRRVAAAIEAADADAVEQNAALIADHLHRAGDLRQAFHWHMRAGSWLNERDRIAAWARWQRAREAATHLPVADPDRTLLETGVLTRLCSEVWKTGGDIATTGYDQLRRLCEKSGDRRSLAIATAGVVMAMSGQHRHREAMDLVGELMTLLELIDEPTLRCALLLAVAYAKSEVGELGEALHLVQRVIDLADGDLARGRVLFASPLAGATRMRGLYRLCLGVKGWRADGDAGVAMARGLDPTSRVSSILYKYILAVPAGARRVDEQARCETADALRVAEQAGDEHSLTLARTGRGLVLVYGNDPGQEGIDLLEQAHDTTLRRRFTMNAATLIDPAKARYRATHGDVDGAIDLARDAIARMATNGEVLSRGIATTVLVESLLARGDADDLAESAAAVDRLAAAGADSGLILDELPRLRLSALIARRRGDAVAAEEFRRRHHIAAVAAEFDLADQQA
ncbi:ATP-binding protein [Mycobacterium sp. NPDC050041]|uniref:ATP-binding protein n=1 Tax=Mycobacterium sp. NPDC050041 TaxID=3364293 RepID=UPI003C2CDB45